MSTISRAAICIGIQLPLGSLQNSISHSLFSVAAVGARMQARFTERPVQEYPRAHPLGLCGYTVLATLSKLGINFRAPAVCSKQS